MGATKTAVLAVRIISDAKDSARGFEEAERGVGKFEAGARRAGVAATVALGAIGAMAKQAFDSASALQQATGAVESVFGAQANAVKANAAAAAQAVGLANSQYSDLAAVLGSQLKNMGTAADQLAPQTDKLIGLGADLAATYGGTTSEAVAALSSLLRGETDPIERYGVSIKQSDINARLAAAGQDKLTGAAAKSAQAQAVLALLTDQTSSALGAFTREGDTAAGQTQRAAAEFENAKAALGEALLPMVTEVAKALGDLARIIGENKDVVGPLVAIFTAVAAAIWLVNIALYANPFTLIALAIGAVVAILVVLWMKFEGFRDVVGAIGRFLGRVFDPFLQIFRDLWDRITNAGNAFDVLKAIAVAALDVILAPLRTVWNILKEVGKGIAKIPGIGKLFGAPSAAAGAAATATAGMYGAAAVSPGLRAAGALVGASAVGSGAGLSSAGTFGRGGDTIRITIQGAVDPERTADQVGQLLERRDKQLGRIGGLTVGLAR